MGERATNLSDSNGHYPFSAEYQRNVLACLLDTAFLKFNRDALDWEHFTDPTYATIADEILRYYDKWKVPPSKGSLFECLRKTLRQRKNPSLAECRRTVSLVTNLKRLNPEEVGTTVREFAAVASALPVVVGFQEAVENGDLDDWEIQVKTALSIRHPPPNLTHYDDDLVARLKGYKRGRMKTDPIATSIKALNNYIGGGLDRQELGVVIGLSGVGKSHVMVDLTVTALDAGRKVYYYCCEMKKTKLLARLDRRMTGLYEKDMAKQWKKLSEQLAKKPLRVAHFPEGVLTAGMIRADMDKHGAPDLLIVDYPALMKIAGDADMRFTRFAIEQNYMEVRSIGMEYDCGVWAPFQANRQGHDTEASDGDHVTRKHSAESYGVPRHADIFMSLNQTAQEKEEGRARFLLDKNRDDVSGVSIPVEVDWGRSMIYG